MVELNRNCTVSAKTLTGGGRKTRKLHGMFVGKYNRFFLFKSDLGFNECFLKSDLDGERVKVRY